MSRTHRKKEDRINSPDAHYTPPGLAQVCIRTLIADRWVRSPGTTRVLEPSCGRFAWVRALLDQGFDPSNVWANDIQLDRSLVTSATRIGACHLSGLNFLLPHEYWYDAPPFDLIVGNPPFNDAGSHLEVSFERGSPMGVIAYLLPIGWFTARGPEDVRQTWIAQDAAPSHQYLVSPRPSFSGGSTDAATYALTVWAPGARNGHTTTSLLDWSAEAEAEKAARALARKEARRLAKLARRAA